MEELRELSKDQIKFLKELGLNPDDFLSAGKGADYYRFYCKRNKKVEDIRR